MTPNLSYRIFPDEPNYQDAPLTDWERQSAKGLGVGIRRLIGIAIIFLFVGLSYYLDLLSVLSVAVAIIVASIAVAIFAFAVKTSKIAEIQRRQTEQAHHAEFNRVTQQANNLTYSVLSNYQSSIQLNSALPNHLTQASLWLQTAEREYRSNAFEPFWDAAENAALHLSNFNYKANVLSQNAGEYYRSLNNKRHNFPPFPVQLNILPNPKTVVDQLRRVIRLGQTNYHFANIYAQRQTRDVLIAGFQSLGDAVANMGSLIEDSIYNLQRSVSSDVARAVEEQIRTRDTLDKRMFEQNRMLDNIQHRRKPGPYDSPSTY